MLQTKSNRFYEKWEKTRTNKLKFILKNSALYYALPYTVIMSLFNLVDKRFLFSLEIATTALKCFIVAIIIGAFAEHFNFKHHEKVFHKLKQKH